MFSPILPTLLAQQGNLKRLENLAKEHMRAENWAEARLVCADLLNADPANPDYHLMLGICMQNTGNTDKSLPHLKIAQAGNPDPVLNFYLGRSYHFNLKFDSAQNFYLRYLDHLGQTGLTSPADENRVKKYIEECKIGKILLEDSLELEIVNLGNAINSPYPEYVPLITPDENTLIFTSRRENTTGGKKDPQGLYLEDIYISTRNPNGQWSEPVNKLPFNSREHDACVGLSVDGKTMILYKPYNEGDLYISHFDGKKWSEAELIEGEVNTPYWESSATMTLDEQYLYFTSDKPGGYGGSDIYMAEKLENGKWGKVVNLGPVINTPYDEDAPQIHADNLTLFFSSRGHKSMGGYDVFSTVFDYIDSVWSEPRNIGFPVNTPGDDIYFYLVANGSKGYFSSMREDSYGEKDIYVMLRPGSIPTRFLMKFRLYDHFYNRPIEAQVRIVQGYDGKQVPLTHEDPEKGKYSCVLDFETEYYLEIDAPGYMFQQKPIHIGYRADIFEYVMNINPAKEEVIELVDSLITSEFVTLENVQLVENEYQSKSEKLSDNGSFKGITSPAYSRAESTNYADQMPFTTGLTGRTETEKVIQSLGGSMINKDQMMDARKEIIYVARMDTNEKIVMGELRFGFNSFLLDSFGNQNLKTLAGFIKDVPNIHVLVIGHTDGIGNETYNFGLSERRARSVKNELTRNGISTSRIHTAGYGATSPIASNKSVYGRQVNRRADIILIDISDPKYQDPVYHKLVSQFRIPLKSKEGYVTPFIVQEMIPLSAHFTRNNYKLFQYSRDKLDVLAQYLQQVPYQLILIGVSEPDENNREELERERVNKVIEFLVEAGVQKDKLIPIERKYATGLAGQMVYQPGVDTRRVQFLMIKN